MVILRQDEIERMSKNVIDDETGATEFDQFEWEHANENIEVEKKKQKFMVIYACGFDWDTVDSVLVEAENSDFVYRDIVKILLSQGVDEQTARDIQVESRFYTHKITSSPDYVVN